jgi:hypothetical protein
VVSHRWYDCMIVVCTFMRLLFDHEQLHTLYCYHCRAVVVILLLSIVVDIGHSHRQSII